MFILVLKTLREHLDQTLALNPAGVSYPPTPQKLLPLPSKTPYPQSRVRAQKGKGQGQPKMTLGLPLPITNSNNLPKDFDPPQNIPTTAVSPYVDKFWLCFADPLEWPIFPLLREGSHITYLIQWFNLCLNRIWPINNIHAQSMPCFTMATDLRIGMELPLDLTPGKVIAFKSTKFDLSGSIEHKTHLKLYNQDNDILLCIRIRRGCNKVFFNDRADKALLSRWETSKSVDLNPMDVDTWHLEVTITVHNCSTHASEWYQILFNLTTMYIFNTHFIEPAVKVVYQQELSDYAKLWYNSQVSDPLKFFFYKLGDLPPEERKAIESGRSVDICEWSFLLLIRL